MTLDMVATGMVMFTTTKVVLSIGGLRRGTPVRN